MRQLGHELDDRVGELGPHVECDLYGMHAWHAREEHQRLTFEVGAVGGRTRRARVSAHACPSVASGQACGVCAANTFLRLGFHGQCIKSEFR